MSTGIRRYYRGHRLVTLRDVQAGQSKVYHFDHQGTTQALTDNNGNVSDRFTSDAWGNEVSHSGVSENKFWYLGGQGYYIGDTSKQAYVRQRYLSVESGTWKCKDYIASDNMMNYADSNPARYSDPLGLCAPDACSNAIGGAPDPCKWAERNLDLPEAYGWVFCCKGKKYVCAPPSGFEKGTPAGVQNCVKIHEQRHVKDVFCHPDDLSIIGPGESKLSREEFECAGYRAEIKCYEDSAGKACSEKKGKKQQIECCKFYRVFCIDACEKARADCGISFNERDCIQRCRTSYGDERPNAPKLKNPTTLCAKLQNENR